jgi:hypothetical protein
MASKLKLTELLHPDSAVAAITINADNSVTIPTQSTTNLAYTGTLTGGTGVVNIGSGQIYKDASGNVGIGTASPGQKLDVNGVADFGSTAVARIRVGLNGDSIRRNGNLFVVTEGAFDLRFQTNSTERARIDSSGNLLVGTTSGTAKVNINNTGGGGSYVTQTSAGGYNFVSNALPLSSVYYHIQFLQSGTPVGSILSSGSSTSYNTSSDYRLKENVAPMTGALEKVAALKPCTYTWKADGSAGQGFIAHELQEVVPDCVTGEKDALDKDGKPTYQGVDTSFLVATLVAALQEQQALIQDLTTRLTALEGN